MELKHSRRKPWWLIGAASLREKSPGLFWVVSLIVYTALVFAVSAYVYRAGVFSDIKPLIRQNVHLISKVARGMLSEPEHITIDIKHKHFMKLAHTRQVALERGILLASSNDYVPARIRYKDKTFQVKIRLKGDLKDHWEGAEKWSFRIRVKGENTFWGMKQFSLQHPMTRGYIYEWLYHQALKREGLISLRYDFIVVTVNGREWGIYALEEHFEKRLIENNALREGPIVRFSEDLVWEEELQQGFPNKWRGRLKNGSGSFLSSEVDAFQTRRLKADPAMYVNYTTAIQLLESFRRGILKTSDVFDFAKLAKYFALADVMGASHGAFWMNARFYYNPVTSRLEPIGFDARGDEPLAIDSLIALKALISYPDKEYYYYYLYYLDRIFSDQVFLEEYINELERISEPSYLDALFEELSGETDRKLDILYREFPEFNFVKDVFYDNQKYIRTVLNPVRGIRAYSYKSLSDRIVVQAGNIQYLPVEVIGAAYKDAVFSPEDVVVLPGKRLTHPVNYQKVSFIIPDDMRFSENSLSELKVNYRIVGTSRIKSTVLSLSHYLDDDFAEHDFMRKMPNYQEFHFIKSDEKNKKIYIKPGKWNLDRNLIIPEGYTVVAGEGTELNLTNASVILSLSPLEFRGSEDHPVIVQSTDSSGQGIVVMSAHQTSVLEYVVFKKLSHPLQGSWQLTGAVTFYESPVYISHTAFLSNRSEDALNIIRSEFTIHKSLFTDTLSDAFDADFATGKIMESSFLSSGNDAVDVSGSVINIQDVFINGAGDKGLSAGENSRVTVSRIDIRNAEIAVASKDISETVLNEVHISDAKIGYTAYQKKSEFGPSVIEASSSVIDKTDMPYLIEENSKMIVDGREVASSRKNVKQILYGVEYGKSSK